METDQDGQDIRQMFYNNLQLLDFNTTAMEAEHRIQFNKYMFDLPNRRGAELVLHFLFQRLNPTMCKEAFRDSWPIFDKKREQQFRKTCTQWLSNIAQDEADSHLPRVTASLLMSPGGEKFYQLLFFFSGYVLRKVMETELGVKTEDLTRYPSVSGQSQSALGEVQLKAITCSAIRHRKQFVNTVQLNVRASQQWKHSADEFVREHRRLTKQGRELDYKIREEDQRAQQAALSRGSPVKKRSSVEHFDPEFDPKTIKRSQRVQQVRDLWKQVEGFTSSEAAEREVVESIVQRTVNRHRLDGAELAVTVPDLLLRECQEEIRRRNVDNTYKGGKLNIVSVLQLWNLALHLYLEKLRQVGLPQFNGEVDKLTSQAHVQQNYTQKTQTLRHQMAENIPKLKASIGELRSRLDNIFFNEQPAESIRTTSLGIGLVEPSPKQSFSPSDTVTPSSGVRVPALQEYVVDTPEASRQISEQMELRARRNLQHNFAEPSVGSLKTGVSSGIPKADSMKPGARPSSRPTSARSTTSSRGSSASVKSTPRSSKSDTRQQQQRKQQQPKQQPNGGQRAVSSSSFSHPEVSTPRTAVADISVGDSFTGTSHKPSIHHDEEILGESFQSLNASCDSKASSKQSDGDRTLTEKSSPRSSSSRTPRSPRVKGEGHQRSERRSAADLLVDEIMGEGKILSPFNSGMEAFETRAVVNRTPDLEENTNNPTLSPIRGALETAGDAPSSLTDVNTELSDVRGGLDRIKDALANVKGELEKATVGNSEFELDNAEGPGTPNNSERGDQLDETITPPNSPRGEGADNIGDVIATPPNSVDQGEEGGVSGRNEDDDNQIVNVLGPELDDIEAPVSTGNDAATVSFEDILARAKKVLGPKYLAESDGKKVDLEQKLFNEDCSVPNKVDSVSAQLEDIQDNVVDTLIQEGIRQATDEAYDDDDTPGVNIEASHAGYDHQGVDGDDFVEEIQGPELEDDYNDDDVEQNDDDDDDAGSVRSTEELIVIDKSLHMSPTSPRQQGVRTPVDVGPLDSPDADLEDEQFPAIIIDRSFQFTQVTRSGATCSPGRDRLSQSLATDQRSPLSEEIRQMFRKAVAETPSRRAHPKETDADSELELPNMNPLSRCGNKDDDTKQRQHLQQQLSDQQGGLSQADPSWQLSDQQGRLSQADPSWQLSDNLDDVEFPNIRLVEDNDLEPGGQGHTAGILDLDESDFKLETGTNASITEAHGALGHDSDEDELDDFFASKAKELGRKFVDDLGSDEENGNVLGSCSSPRFGLLEDNSDKDESPLISLSP